MPIPIGLGAGSDDNAYIRNGWDHGTRPRQSPRKRAQNGERNGQMHEGEETELDRRPTLSTIRVVTHPSKFPRKMRW